MNPASTWACAGFAAALVGSFAQAQTTVRVSVTSTGAEADFGSLDSSVSASGRFIAFMSTATNLVPGDTNGVDDVFVRDLQSGTTERVSVSSGGAQGNSYSDTLSISADGRFVAFWSIASNLVAGDTNGVGDVFVRDRLSGTTERVSVGAGGVQGVGASASPSISADGRFVAFGSAAANLVAGDSNGWGDVFVRDRLNATTERVSVATAGTQGDGDSGSPSISPDGRFVAFQSVATTFAVGDGNGFRDIFVRDRQTGTTERVSVATNGAEGNAHCFDASISADGRCVAFYSTAATLVAGDTNSVVDVFVHDRQSGTTERVSVDTAGTQGNAASSAGVISGDGRYVAFFSSATNLVAGDTNVVTDVFVRDRSLGTTARVSVSSGGAQANNYNEHPSISADGRFVAFYSGATNFITGDLNGAPDVYLRDRGITASPAFCFGDGSGTACPCGNSGIAGNGCASSANANGGHLSGNGTASVLADTLVLAGSAMPNSAALYFQGTTQQSGGAGALFGDGLRCAGGTIVRIATRTNVGGASQYPQAGDPALSVKGAVTATGLRTYQVWYRNAAAFCTPSTFNLTNGVAVTWLP